MARLLIVPPDRLSREALEGLIEEFVSREGTEYGHGDHSLESKRAEVLRQVERGEVVIVFDLESQSCNLVPQGDLPKR
jgi:uncharacterized protein YheU (UPF0270 family)